MRTSIATVSVSGNLEDKLRAIAAAGFAGAEIFENDLLSAQAAPREVGRMMRDLGLACTVFQPFRDFEGMPTHMRQRTFDRAERKFDVMEELGTDLLLVCSNVSPLASGDRQRCKEDLRELGERAAARGLRIGFEALSWGRHIWDHRDAWSIVRDVDHGAVGLVLDSFHSLARNVPIDSLHWIDARKVFLVQLADAPILNMDPLSWSRHFRCMPAQGELPLVDYVAALAEIGYDGFLSLEIFNDRFRAHSTAAVALDGHRSLTFLLDRVQRKVHPREPAPLADPVRCHGVEFVELCASAEEAKPLGMLLESLGFSLIGRHRSKDVTRWAQGGINVVVNCEAEGFAHSYDTVHGASVCALGLAVSDAEAAMRRAAQLQVESFTQPLGPGELPIPAVKGVGGSLIYFVNSCDTAAMWAHEFEPLAVDQHCAGAGLLCVDHIVQAMSFDEMLTWQLYYLSLFDLSKAAAVEIPDPVGLVVSQALQSADGTLRITLNGSTAAQTLASRFLSAFMGAGVQHIALRSANILESARALRERGMEFLPIPDNYYDDLVARFGLAEETIRPLAEYNILYDRDEAGEYFQLYSRAFAKRFFFEVVERRNYGGYGAANAGIRIAAQSRYKSG